MKKLPIGIQTFAILREEGYCYVDKTPLIARLVEQGRYYFLARPRRFGKSLLVTTLTEAFAGNQALFDGLYLADHWDWQKPHPVIRLDLGGGVLQTRAQLDTTLRAMLGNIAAEQGVELRQSEPQLQFQELISVLHRSTGQRVVVLVDEYDKPILDNIEHPGQAAEMREGLRNLYSVLKAQDAHLQFVLLTGVSKFAKVSIFSGLNNLEDITLDPRFATLCGYTQTELETVFAEYLEGVDLQQLRHWYNGYNFLGEPVYNPFDVLLYLRNRRYRSYWFETGTPTFLMELMHRRAFPAPRLENLEASSQLLGSFDIEQIEPEVLLFQAGYLTILEERQLAGIEAYRLGFPNQEVRQSLSMAYLRTLSRAGSQQDANQLALYRALEADDPAALEGLFRAFFAAIPHDWYRKNQLAGYEGYYASVVYCYFNALGLEVVAEDATNHGRIDLAVKLPGQVWLIEFKVAEEDTAAEALAQIRERGYAQKYAGQRLCLVGVAFSPQARNVVGFAWERQE